jgi:hypothetical protein
MPGEFANRIAELRLFLPPMIRTLPLVLPLLASLVSARAAADPWIAPGDARLRHDLQLLSDAGIVRAPLTAWPVPWAEVARDVQSVSADIKRPAYVDAALARVRAAARDATTVGVPAWHARIAGSAEPMTLRRYSDVPREEGELTAGVQYTGERFAYRLQATGVADADDDQDIRPDGSYVGVVLGNWILSAGYIDRWWGPGWEGSLILGTNARPIPAITLERNYSDAPDVPGLAWLGQFRSVITMAQFEHGRDAPRCAALRHAVAGCTRGSRSTIEERPVAATEALRREIFGTVLQQRQRPGSQRTAGQPDGRRRFSMVRAASAGSGICAGDRRG